MSERVSQPADFEEDEIDRSRDEIEDVPVPEYDPRPQEDVARRRIAYTLIGLLAILVIGMLALICLEIIVVGDIKEFGVILGPLVAMVSAATGFYYGTTRQGDG